MIKKIFRKIKLNNTDAIIAPLLTTIRKLEQNKVLREAAIADNEAAISKIHKKNEYHKQDIKSTEKYLKAFNAAMPKED